MSEETKPEAEEPECGFGKCNPAHPLHCCHTAVSVREPVGRGMMLCGWACVTCKGAKHSKKMVLVKMGKEPTV